MPVAQGTDIPFATFRQVNKIPVVLELPIISFKHLFSLS